LDIDDTRRQGGFNNFQNPDESSRPLQSGSVNFYASMALLLFNEITSSSLADPNKSTFSEPDW
jgi:hypothetical protein